MMKSSTSDSAVAAAAGEKSRRPYPEITGLLLLALALLFNAVLLAPEARIERVPVNDLPFQIGASERLGESIAHAEPFLDPWVSQWSLGFPLWRIYQPLPHLVAAAVIAVCAPFASPASSFAFFYYLLLVLLPASCYLGTRLMGFNPVAAGLASILVLMPNEGGDFGRYGLSYGAYVWRGSGLYTELFALLVMLPALGLMARAVPMPIAPADISNFDLRDDKVFYSTGPSQMIEGPLPGEKPVLHVYDLKERKDEKVLEDLSSYALSADGKKVLYKVEKDYFIADAVAEKGKSEEGRKKLDLSHLRVRVEPAQEWVEMFNSAWRLERDFFYSAKMNGVDWQAVRASSLQASSSAWAPFRSRRFRSCIRTKAGARPRIDCPASSRSRCSSGGS